MQARKVANYPQTSSSEKRAYALKASTPQKVLKSADEMLQRSLKGEFMVLRTAWSKINRMLLGGFFFGQIYLIAGASGHGKSYFLNLIIRAMVSKKLNNPTFKFRILHFGFEMSPEMELLRKISSITKIPFRKLVSSDDPLNKDEYERIKKAYTVLNDDPILYFDQPGTRYEIEATIRNFKKKFPDEEVVVSIDHSLLVVSEPGENEITTLSALGKMCIALKKEFNICFIILGQMNDKIEGEKRRDPTNPALHYPTKTDIHGSKQLYHASDVVIIIHQPALLNLEYYGKKNIPTKDLIVIHCIKQRNGLQYNVLMDNDLGNGMIRQRKEDKDHKDRVLASLGNDS